MTKNDTEKNIIDTNTCTCHSLAYFLLSSACLSNGAQGQEKSHRFCKSCINIQNGYSDYKNFEIGVLLHSNKDHIYKVLDKDCSVHNNYNNNNENNKVEIIPLPYDVKLDKFCSSNEYNTIWDSRPYFNEDWMVESGTLTSLSDMPPCSEPNSPEKKLN